MKNFFEKNQSYISIIAPVSIVAIFVILACLNINGSIWFDESFTSYLIRGNFVDIWQLTAVDVHPPFFYFCLKIWSLIFGNSIVALRFMSVFFGGISLILIFHLVKRWFNLKTAIISTFFISLSPMLIRYSQEMRMYTLLLFIIVSATYVLTLALEKKRRSLWILYGLLVSIGMYTHYFSALVWLFHLGTIIYQSGGFKKAWQNKSIIFSYATAILLYLPWLPCFVKQTMDVQGGFWIGPMTILTPVDLLSDSLIYQPATEVKNWLAVLLAVTVAIIIFFAKKVYKKIAKSQQKHYKFILANILFPPIILMVLSLPPMKPLFVNRYVYFSTVLLWAFLGIVISFSFSQKISHKYARLCLLVAVITTAFVGIMNVETRQPNGHIKDILVSAQQMSKPGEPILSKSDWNYYDAAAYSSDQHPVWFVKDWSKYQWGSLYPIRRYQYNVAENLPKFTSNNDQFWYLATSPKNGKKIKVPHDIAKHYRVVNKLSNEHYTMIEFKKLETNTR